MNIRKFWMAGHGYFCHIVFHNLHAFLKISKYLPPNGPRHGRRELSVVLWVNGLCLPEVQGPACVLMESLDFQTTGNNQPAFSRWSGLGPACAAEKSQGNFNFLKNSFIYFWL